MRGLLVALFVALLVVPAIPAEAMLVAVLPDLPSGDAEGFAVGCTSTCDLAGWSVTDDEGTFRFPGGDRTPEAAIWFRSNGTGWREHGGPAAATWDDDRLRLADGGEALRLLRPDGSEADRFTWGPDGDVGTRSPGLVYLRRADGPGGWQDTDAAADWQTPRLHRIGESDLDRPTFRADAVTLYASPDSSFIVLQDLLLGARERLHLHVYDVRHAALSALLLEAIEERPGLDVQVLVDAAPAGLARADRDVRSSALAVLADAGAKVVEAGGRYDHHHLKVLVADDRVAVQSENWVRTGVPVDASWGNRGWGVVVESAAMADWMAGWMQDDRTAWDARPIGPDVTPAPQISWPALSGAHEPVPPVRFEGPVSVTPIVAPDHTADPGTDPVTKLFASAQRRILGEQLTLRLEESNRLGWQRPDRIAENLSHAAARGVGVGVLVDDLALRDLESMPAWARPFERDWAPRLHNKAWVVDDAIVIGSMNANHASRSQNREVSVLIEDARVADVSAAWWAADAGGPQQALPAPPLPMLFAALAVALARSRRP